MKAKNIWKILHRTWGKTLLFVILLTLVSTFLCLGAGVWLTAQRGIARAEQSFTTIVAPSLPAMRETAGLKDNPDPHSLVNPYFTLDDVAASYRHWVEQQNAWQRYGEMYRQIQQTGLSIPQVQMDTRRMAMAFADGLSSVRPEDVDGGMLLGYYFPPHDRVAYVVECTDSATFEWDALVYAGDPAVGTLFGCAYEKRFLTPSLHLPHVRGFTIPQPDVQHLSGPFAAAALKVEEVVALQPQAIREPSWLFAAERYVQPQSDSIIPHENPFEPGKRYLVIGRYISEGGATGSGIIRDTGEITDDPYARFENRANGQGGIGLLPYSWIDSNSNPSTPYSNFTLGERSFSYDDVRVEIDGTLEDFLADPANAYWKDTIDNIQITNHSMQVLTTNNTQSLFPFNQNHLSVIRGRDISAEEFTQGEKVCLISENLAQLNKIALGDGIPLQFYPGRFSVYPYSESIFSNPTFIAQPMPYDSSLEMTAVEEYIVVGIYSGEVPWDIMDYSIGANTIILPNEAMPLIEDDPPAAGGNNMPSPLLFGLTIPNGQAETVYDALNGMEFGRLYSIMDQGYSIVVPGLTTIRNNAAWLMGICLIAWVAALILFLLLFIFRRRGEVGLMRSFGADRHAVVRYLLTMITVVALTAGLLSAGACLLLYDSAFDIALHSPSMEEEWINEYSQTPVVRDSENTKQGMLRNALVPENKEGFILGVIGGQCCIFILASWIYVRRLSRINPMVLSEMKGR